MSKGTLVLPSEGDTTVVLGDYGERLMCKCRAIKFERSVA